MAIDANNPVYKYFEGQIPTVIKDVIENGTVGTASKRIMENISKAVIKETFFFNENSRKLRGQGTRLNKFKNFTRKGWRERQNPDYPIEDYDFLGLGVPSVLTENVPVAEAIKSGFEYHLWDLKDTEAGYDMLYNLFQNMLMEELPIIYEKRYVNTIQDAIQNGVTLLDDKNTGAVALVPQVSININDETNTKAAVKTIKNVINTVIQLDNPFFYKPTADKWVLLVNNRLDDALQELGAYQAFGDRIVSNKATEGYLSNSPIKFIKDKVQVIMLQELPEWISFILWPISSKMQDKALLYTAPPTQFTSRTDFVGVSSSIKFFEIESDSFTSGKISYWLTKAGGWFVGLNGGGAFGPGGVRAWFSDNNITNGNINVNYAIDVFDQSVAAGFTVRVYNDSFEEVYNSTTAGDTIIIDGSDTQFSIEGLPSGTYWVAVTIDTTIDPSPGVPRDVYVSSPYMLKNKTWTKPMTGEVSNQSLAKINKTFKHSKHTIIRPSKKRLEVSKKEVSKK